MSTNSSSAASTPTALATSLASGNFGGAAYAVSATTPTGLGSDGLQCLNSLFHVRWMMEIVGQAFTLPLEDINVASNAAAIYIQWLVEPNKRPLAIQKADYETRQWFLQTLFRHISLVFQAKKVDGVGAAKPLLATLASKHVELCKLMLRTLSQTAMSSSLITDQESCSALSGTSWKVLLRVLLGVTDFLLQKPSQPYCYLSEELGEQLLSILMELWMRSQIFSSELWALLKTLYPRWTHRMIAVTQWSAVSLALTQRVTKILYGQGTSAVVYTVHSNLVTLDLSDQYAVYAWHQVLHIIGSPNGMNPQVFFRSVLGMEKLVQVFHSIGNTDNAGALQRCFPDGNTILHLFGSWLFEAVNRDALDCAEGRAQAFGVLCRVFSHPQRRNPFLATYLHQFYAAVIEGLKGDLLSLVFIVVNCEDIFALQIPGVRILVAPFVKSLRRIIPKLEKPLRVSLNLDDLRRACYKLLCTIFGFCDHFGNALVRCLSPSLEGPTVQSIEDAETPRTPQKAGDEEFVSQLKTLYRPILGHLEMESGSLSHARYWILEMLVSSFLGEKDSGNLRYLINSLTSFTIDDAHQTPGIAAMIVDLLTAQLCAGKWSVDVCLVALESLCQFSTLESVVSKQDPKAVRRLVISLCEYSHTLISRNNLSVLLKPIISTLDCLLDWIIGTDSCSLWFSSDTECQSAVINLFTRTLLYGREFGKRNEGQETHASPVVKSVGDSRVQSPSYSLATSPSMSSVMAMPIKSLEGQLVSTAEIALARLLQYYGCGLSNPFFPVHTSSLLNECLLLNKKTDRALDFISGSPKKISSLTREELQNMRYFILNGSTIVCFIERPAEANLQKGHIDKSSVTELVTLLRSFSGKSAWESSLVYTTDSEKYRQLLSVNTMQGDDPTNEAAIEVLNETAIDKVIDADLFASKNHLADSLNDQLALIKAHPELESVPLQLNEIGPVFNSDAASSRFARDDKRALNYTCIEGLAREQIKKTKGVLIQDGDALRSYGARPTPASTANSQYARLLLSQIGMTSLKARDSALKLPSCVELLSDLEILDSLPERETLSCSVFYIKSGRMSLHAILEEELVSADYAQFVRTLGWPVDLKRHSGWSGSLNNDISSTMPYFANSDVEIVFHVPSLMDRKMLGDLGGDYNASGRSHNPPPSCTQSPPLCPQPLGNHNSPPPGEHSLPAHASGLYKIIANDMVSILWIEDLEEMLTLPSKFQTRSIVYICISPLSDPESAGLYRIRIMVTSAASVAMSSGNGQNSAAGQTGDEAAFLFGPLLDGMIIRRESLGRLVRETVISSCLFCLYGIQSQQKPLAKRAQFIHHVANKYRLMNLTPAKYYNELIYNAVL